MLILFVIIIAFGVTIQSLMYHNQVLNSELIQNVFFPPYMMIAGEYGIYETMTNSNNNNLISHAVRISLI